VEVILDGARADEELRCDLDVRCDMPPEVRSWFSAAPNSTSSSFARETERFGSHRWGGDVTTKQNRVVSRIARSDMLSWWLFRGCRATARHVVANGRWEPAEPRFQRAVIVTTFQLPVSYDSTRALRGVDRPVRSPALSAADSVSPHRHSSATVAGSKGTHNVTVREASVTCTQSLPSGPS
jgi:hypothetical protein